MAAATVSKEFFSQSTDGTAILVAATSTAGTAIHTAHATLKDEVWLWLHNTSTAAVEATVEFGGVATKDQIKKVIPAKSGPVLMVPGIPLSGSKAVAVFAATGNVLGATGYVNRITNPA